MVNLRSEYGVTVILVIVSNSSYEKHIYPFQQLCLLSANYNKHFPSLAYDIMTVLLWLSDQTGHDIKLLQFVT